MNKLFLFLSVVLATAIFAIGEERKQYNSTMAGMTYFVKHTQSVGASSVTYTNNEIEMWYPSKIYVGYETPIPSTNILSLVKVIPALWVAPDTITTNESGTVSTNHFHGSVTNTTYTYLTNTLCTITNTASINIAVSEKDLTDVYVQKGDILIWTIGTTNACWLSITGKR